MREGEINLKVLFITNVPFPYTVDYLEELGKYCELVAVFERKSSSERDKSWDFYKFKNCKAIILKGIHFGVEASINLSIVSQIRKQKADIILISNPCTPTGIVAQEYMRIHKIPYCIQSEGAFVGTGWGLKERLKHHVMKNADLYFSTGKSQDDYFLKYGAEIEQLRRFPFTTMHENEILNQMLSKEYKEQIKEKLGLDKKFVLLTIGQFIPRKGIIYLLQAIAGMKADIQVIIIGGECKPEYEQLCEEINLQNVLFKNFMDKQSLLEYYKAADLFVLPTLYDTWGLVNLEAMSMGVPVISTTTCVSAITLIEDEKNGYVVPPANANALKEKIEILYNDEEKRLRMGECALQRMQHYSIERMAIEVYGEIEKKYIEREKA